MQTRILTLVVLFVLFCCSAKADDAQQLAKALGWQKTFADELERTSDPASDKAELRRLRRENEILRQERDILKKAMAIFSKTPK